MQTQGMADSNGNKDNEKITVSAIITCIVAATGGLFFGYDIGISGGITTMVPFLEKFFPSVIEKMAKAKQNDYCMYDSQVITAFTSSLYIAGLVATMLAGPFTTSMGRKASMLLGGFIFSVGTIINALAINVFMLIFGRILLGFGIGSQISTQDFVDPSFDEDKSRSTIMVAAPVYLTEMAPSKWRGAFNSGFEFFLGVGTLAASLVNFWASHYGDWGWRLATGMGVVPSLIMTIGVLFIPDTPSSLVGRGRLPQARQSLAKVRGVDSDIEAELSDIINKDSVNSESEAPFKMIIQRRYRPQLVTSLAIPFFQQLTGVSIAAFYAPVLCNSIGLGSDSGLIVASLLAIFNITGIVISTFLVDRCGRKTLLLEAGIQMFIAQVVIAGVLGYNIWTSGNEPITKGTSAVVIAMLCFHAISFGWSYGPLNWLVPSEILPMEVRAAGQSLGVATNLVVTFIMAQIFLSLLCHLKYAMFLFFAAWLIVMTVFMILFLPETKGISLEAMDGVWRKHWYWKRFMDEQPLKDQQFITSGEH